jgi:hypothetical protein
MCSGNADKERRKQEKRAREQQKEYERQAAAREAQLAAIAAERQEIADQQAVRLTQLNQQRDDAIEAANANQNVIQEQADLRRKNLRDQRDADVARAEELMAQAEETTANAKAAGSAVSASLRTLAKSGQKQGKTATVSKKRRRPEGSRQTTASLNIGSTGSGRGSGSNLSI